MITLVLLAAVGCTSGDQTVLVTPRPRWVAQEPRADPSSPHVPAILPPRRLPVFSLRIIPSNPNHVMSAALPAEHRDNSLVPLAVRKPVLVTPMQPIVVLQGPSAFTFRQVNHQPQNPPPVLRETVYVDTQPSVSIQIGDEEDAGEVDGLPQFLTPPKYPSVYETIDDSSESLLSPIDDNGIRNNKLEGISDIEETENDIEDSSESDFRKQKAERVEFQLHGQAGPESYKFGFDTGAGKNRQFRYEEKDAVGNVKGHFGYYDTTGKLQLFNYRADETGFHAEQVD